jgi:Tfp pilus assembly protein PilO
MNAAIDTLEPRQMQLLGYGVLALLFAVLAVYVVLPVAKEFRSTGSSLALLRAGASDGVSLEAQLSKLRADVASLEKTLNGDASNLPAKQMEAFVIGRLQTISWQNDVVLASVQPREGTPINQFRELIFDVELEGDYFDFFEWLRDIDKELGFVVVKRFQIARSNRSGANQAPLEVDLTMAAYRSQ